MSSALPSGIVTMLFTDIEGSTSLLARLGDDYERVLGEHHRIIREAVDRRDGAEVRTQGDSFFLVFANPAAAVEAAIEAQLALSRHDWGVAGGLRVRMGIHLGLVKVFRDDYIGMAVHEAARVASAAHGGQVLITDAVRAALADGAPELVDLGQHRLKDLAEDQRLWQLTHPELPRSFAAIRSLGPPTNLPGATTSFVGRDHDVRGIVSSLAGARLVTLYGPGGAGKTRLSTEVAGLLRDEHPDGTWLVELASIRDGKRVLNEVATTLGLRPEVDAPIAENIIAFLRDRRVLLVIDNCEHLIDEVAKGIRALLRGSPNLHVLATSREPLRISGEVLWPVGPLAVPPSGMDDLGRIGDYESVQLFVDRAQQAEPFFRLDADAAPAVAEICRALDGLPLALELAAARVAALDVDEIAQRLESRFRLLDRGFRGELEHHQTLRAVIDWSFELLDDAQRTGFVRLGSFAGRFRADAATAVAAGAGVDPQDVPPLLDALVERSLLMVSEGSDAHRYGFLETVREYASERLAESSEEDIVRERHLRWAISVAEMAETKLAGAESANFIRRLEADHDDLRAALAWSLKTGRDGEALRLACALGDFWSTRGYYREGRAWLERAMAGLHDDLELVARAQFALARLAVDEGEYDDALELLTHSLEVARRAGYQRGEGRVLNLIGTVSGLRGDHITAHERFEAALASAVAAGDDRFAASCLSNLASTFFVAGEPDRAVAALEESLALSRTTADEQGEARALANLGFVAMQAGDDALAKSRFERAVSLLRHAGNKRDLARIMNMLGTLEVRSGRDAAAARTVFEESLALAEDVGDQRMTATSLSHLAGLASSEGRHSEAFDLYRRSLPLFVRIGDPGAIVPVVEGIASAAAGMGEADLATRLRSADGSLEASDGGRVGMSPSEILALVESRPRQPHP